MTDHKVLFIVNKYSGTGYSPAIEEKILAQCKKRNLECAIEFTQEPGHATTLARMAVDNKFKMVFAVGGDGTMNEVAQGLLHSPVAMGIIPKGSGNGLARHLRIPFSIDDALQLLDMKKTINIDTININNHLSVNVSGIGFDGHIAEMFARDGNRGLFTYGKLVVSQFNKFESFECQVSLDGVTTQENLFSISFANSSQFGNNAFIAPTASLCDQLIDVCMVNKMNTFQGIQFVRKLFNKTLHQTQLVRIAQAREIKITTQKKIPFHIDGEAATATTSFDIRINPASLRVISSSGNYSI
ncbi:MAG: YegS/Rv2252/BmrU family lipid kinase [Cyclobacteriaceae bacterium]|nr:YegS/Rv2252/BmrU family lipid kinase [Cyclobacteriaceae bacterium]